MLLLVSLPWLPKVISILDRVQATGTTTPKSVPEEVLVVFCAPLPYEKEKPLALPALLEELMWLSDSSPTMTNVSLPEEDEDNFLMLI